MFFMRVSVALLLDCFGFGGGKAAFFLEIGIVYAMNAALQ